MLPLGISELGLPGVRTAPMPAELSDRCLTDAVTVDGVPWPVRLTGTTADALDGRPIVFAPCSDEPTVALTRGTHELRVRRMRNEGLIGDRILLTSAAGGAAASLATIQADRSAATSAAARPDVQVLERGRTSMKLRVTNATEGSWLVLGESLNPGWKATVGGKDLGPARLVDGYANGWQLPGRAGARVVTLEWTPQQDVGLALWVSALAGLMCLGIVLVSWRRRRAVLPAAADGSHEIAWVTGSAHSRGAVARIAVVLGSGLATAVLVRPVWAIPTVVLVGASVTVPWARRVLRVLPAVLAVAVGVYVAWGQLRHSYPPSFGWPRNFERVRDLSWWVVIMLAADVLVGWTWRSATPGARARPDGPAASSAVGAPPRSEMGRAEAVAGGLGLLGIGVVVPLLVTARAGALGIPRSDDWSYLVTLFRWSDTGVLAFNHWVSMTLVGQLVLARPLVTLFGSSIWAVQVASAVLGGVGLLALVLLGRETLPGGRGAWLVAFTTAAGPLWAPLAATYMTDVPAFTFEVASLAFGAIAFRRRALGWLAAATALGLWGFGIRQYGAIPVVALLAVAAWTAWTEGERARVVRVALLGVGAAVVAGAILLWFSSIPDPLPVSPSTPTGGTVVATVVAAGGFLRLTGLLLLPVVVWVGPARIARRAWAAGPILTALAALGGAGLLLGTLARSVWAPFVGNYLDRAGVLANDVVAGRRPDVMPIGLYRLLEALGTVAGVLLVVALVPAVVNGARRVRARDLTVGEPMVAVMGLTVLGFMLAYGFAVVTDLPIFDRYVLPVAPLVALLLVASDRAAVPDTRPASSSARRAATLLTLVALGATGLVFSTDSASFDATRWDVAARAAAHGFGAREVYGGFEWVAFHRKVGPLQGDTAADRQRLRARYYRGLCVTVVVNPQPQVAARAIARGEVRGLAHGPVSVVAIRNSRPCRSSTG